MGRGGYLTVSQQLEALRLAAEGAGHLADALPGRIETAQTGLDLFGQLCRLVEARVKHIDLGSSLLVEGGVGGRRRHESDGHGARRANLRVLMPAQRVRRVVLVGRPSPLLLGAHERWGRRSGWQGSP